MVLSTGINRIRTAVFISGTGSNLKSLAKFSKTKISPISINFIVSNTFGHPFYIKTVYVGGSGSQVSTGTVTGTQGTQSGTLSWNTTGVSAGTYYYVCSPHASLGMGGSIVIT